MDPFKYTLVGHRTLKLCAPGSESRADALLERLAGALDTDGTPRVVDIGCGKGEWLMRLARAKRIHGLGVDRNQAFIQMAARAHREQRPDAELVFVCADAAAMLAAEPMRFDAAVSIGASQVFGTSTDNLRETHALLHDRGLLLLGEGFWKKEPEAEFLSAMGSSSDELLSHEGNLQAAQLGGFEIVHAEAVSDDEFRAYEEAHQAAFQAHADESPDDPDLPALLDRARSWKDIMDRWGHATFGFAYYLLRKRDRAT